MSRTFHDENLLVWEAYPSGSRRGFADDPMIIFHCTTDRALRSRFVEVPGDVADAELAVITASDARLLEWLAAAREVA
jgi:hypothetical protein